MRIVTIRHKDTRGKVDYHIYETAEQLLADKPNATILQSFTEAKPGDYIQAQNGWIVPLIDTKMIEDKTNRYGDRKPRKKAFQYKVFHFPKMKKAVRLESLHNVAFNYMPSTMDNFASDAKRCRMFELSAKKILFAQYVVRGYDPHQAVKIAYPDVRNSNRMLKSLLANDKVMDIINASDNSLKSQFDRAGLTNADFALRLKQILDDTASNPKLKIFALDTVLKILSAQKDKKEQLAEYRSNDYQDVSMDIIRARIISSK